MEHPAVNEAYVYGVASAEWGEFPVAQLVLSSGYNDNNELRAELRKFCYSKMSEYKVPKQFIIVSELKKTASGKIIRS